MIIDYGNISEADIPQKMTRLLISNPFYILYKPFPQFFFIIKRPYNFLQIILPFSRLHNVSRPCIWEAMAKAA